MKEGLRKLIRLHDTPHRLAFAFGLGVFLGVIPGTGAIVAAVLAPLLRLNLPLMIAGAMLTNPITTPFVYAGSYLLGRWLLGDRQARGFLGQFVLPTVAGNLPLALFLAVIGYLFVWLLVTWRQSRRSKPYEQGTS